MPRIPKTRARLCSQDIPRRVHVWFRGCNGYLAGQGGWIRGWLHCISTWQRSRNTVWSTSLSHLIRSENGARSLWQDRCLGIHSSLEYCTMVSISVPYKDNSDIWYHHAWVLAETARSHVAKSCGQVWSSQRNVWKCGQIRTFRISIHFFVIFLRF